MIILRLINKVSFFDNFNQEDKVILAETGSFFETFEKDNYIVQEEDQGNVLFVIIRGSVRVFTNKNPDHILATLQAGAVFGEISFLTQRPRTTNVVTNEKTTCFVMNNSTLEEMGPTFQLKFKDQLIEILIRRLERKNRTHSYAS